MQIRYRLRSIVVLMALYAVAFALGLDYVAWLSIIVLGIWLIEVRNARRDFSNGNG